MAVCFLYVFLYERCPANIYLTCSNLNRYFAMGLGGEYFPGSIVVMLSTNWWHGVVGSAFRLKRSYSTLGLVSTAMGDCLRADKPSRCKACQLGRLCLLSSVGW